MNIFSILPIYATKWSVKSTRSFEAEEIELIEHAVVVSSSYGNSVQFTLKAGGMTFIPLDSSSTLGVGELVDLHKAKLVTLGKPGEADIHRVLILLNGAGNPAPLFFKP